MLGDITNLFATQTPLFGHLGNKLTFLSDIVNIKGEDVFMEKENKDIVEVFRFVRPSIVYDIREGWVETEESLHDNLYGVTLFFTINYITRSVEARWSVCNGDNFVKEVGKFLARRTINPVIRFHLDSVQSSGGLTYALWDTLLDIYGNPKNISVPLFGDWRKMLSRITRESRKDL